MHSKGFLKPEDISLVDMTGKQLSGIKKRSSEALLHLEIYKQRKDVKSVVHCHPPHATAFAVAREPIPQCILPEVEVFLGDIPITKYETPGGQAFADTILPFVDKTNVIILANHGTVSFGEDVEKAYWWTEILDAYCRILLLAKQVGRITFFDETKERELLELKAKWGFSDPRNTEDYKNCDVCANDIFRDSWKETGVERKGFPAPPAMGKNASSASLPKNAESTIADVVQSAIGAAPVLRNSASNNGGSNGNSLGVDEDRLVQLITEQVMQQRVNHKA